MNLFKKNSTMSNLSHCRAVCEPVEEF